MFMAYICELENGMKVAKMLRRWEKTTANSYFVSLTEENRNSHLERLKAIERKVDSLAEKYRN